MSSFSITEDEWWPVYEIRPSKNKYSIEIPQDKAEWIIAAKEEFEKTQEYLWELIEGEK